MTKLLGILGSVTPPGRLRSATEFALECAARLGAGADGELVDLADYKISFADGRPLKDYGDDTAAVISRLESADAVLLATPVYRATFTGALKNLLDLTPVEALRYKPLGIVAMGATLHHYLGADWHLRMVLSWFGALTLPTSVYLESSQFTNGRLSDDRARAALSALAVGLIDAGRWDSRTLGPPPLAAGRG
jgi:FMN reductase